MIKIGEKYNMLTVLAEAERDNNSHKQFLCLCDCGNEKVLRSHNVESGHIKSCGCNRDEYVKTHGKTDTNEYRTWNAMKSRCNNPNVTGYENYGGRGISVCQRWSESFEAFFEDMGLKPSDKHSIERLDNDGNYEPSNCTWGTAYEQMRNRRDNINITKDGETHNQTDWGRKFGLSDGAIKRRIQKGMTLEEAVATPGHIYRARPFNVYDKDTGGYIGTWSMKTDCARDLNITSRHIGSVLNGNRNHTGGYIMKYEQEANQ